MTNSRFPFFLRFSLFDARPDLKTNAQKETDRAADSRDENAVRVAVPHKKRGDSD